MNWEEINEIKKEGENSRVEFKTTESLENSKGIAKQLVSFANRNGGKVLFGIRDDGSLEGVSINTDKEILKISQIASDKCSPPIEFSHDHLSSKEGDILVIDVKRRKDIPHAVVKKSGSEIIGREYYIRGAKNKRPVVDKELEWMFEHAETLNTKDRFRTYLTYDKNTLQIPSYAFLPTSFSKSFRCVKEFSFILSHLTQEDKKRLLENDQENLERFVVELSPCIMLKSFLRWFQHSWLVETRREGEELIVSPRNVAGNKDVIDLEKVEMPSNSFLSSLSLNKKLILSGWITVPPNTKIYVASLKEEGMRKSMLRLAKKNLFDFSIKFWKEKRYVGLPPRHPLYIIKDKSLQEIASIQIELEFSTHFGFPDIKDEFISEHSDYKDSILRLIEEEWDYNAYLENIPKCLPYFHLLEERINQIFKIGKAESK